MPPAVLGPGSCQRALVIGRAISSPERCRRLGRSRRNAVAALLLKLDDDGEAVIAYYASKPRRSICGVKLRPRPD
jgi:hypothetical protein